MILRKLSAAVVASAVISSGAWAQQTDDAVSIVTLTVDPVANLYASDAELVDDGNGTDTFTGSIYLCAESNFAGNVIELLPAADFTLDNSADGGSDTIPYTIAGASAVASVNTTLGTLTTKDDGECNNGAVQDFAINLSANVTGAEQGDYSDTITFRLTAQ
jgi:hypothetical protein